MALHQLSVQECISLILYCVHGLLNDKRLQCNPFMLIDRLGKKFHNYVKLNLAKLSSSEVEEKCSKSIKTKSAFDLNCAVLLNPVHLINLRKRNGSWILATCHTDYHNSTEQNHQPLWIRCYSSEDVPEQDCLASPNFFSHLLGDGEKASIIIGSDHSDIMAKKSYFLGVQLPKDDYGGLVPCFASSVSISILSIFDPKLQDTFEDALYEYFECPRLTSIKDVLKVPLPVLQRVNVASNDGNIPTSVNIRITDLKCKSRGCPLKLGHLIQNKITTFYFSPTTKSANILHISPNFDEDTDVHPHLLMSFKSMKTIIFSQLFLPSAKEKTSDLAKDTTRHKSRVENSSSKSAVKSSNSLNPVPVGHILLQGNRIEVQLLLQHLRAGLGLPFNVIECWKLKGDTSSSTEAKVDRALSSFSSSSNASIVVLFDVNHLLKVGWFSIEFCIGYTFLVKNIRPLVYLK